VRGGERRHVGFYEGFGNQLSKIYVQSRFRLKMRVSEKVWERFSRLATFYVS
jgi:hypothetical protein